MLIHVRVISASIVEQSRSLRNAPVNSKQIDSIDINLFDQLNQYSRCNAHSATARKHSNHFHTFATNDFDIVPFVHPTN